MKSDNKYMLEGMIRKVYRENGNGSFAFKIEIVDCTRSWWNRIRKESVVYGIGQTDLFSSIVDSQPVYTDTMEDLIDWIEFNLALDIYKAKRNGAILMVSPGISSLDIVQIMPPTWII